MDILRRALLVAPAALLDAGASATAPSQHGYALQIDEDLPAALHDALRAWVGRSAQAVTGYFGRFPAPQADITLAAAPGAGVRAGRTYDAPPPSIHVSVGVGTTDAQFMADWIMVHEMVHLGISQMPRRHNWFHEGAATYIEIIARARAGLTSREFAWGGLQSSLHHGLPLPGEGGLDGTRRWGRTYWGGALFCLLCDLDIRERTGMRRGLQDAMTGLVAAGSHYGERWPLARTLQVADAATGTTALSDRYAAMRDDAVPVDLDRLFSELGVQRRPGADGVALRPDAPRAGTRRAIIPES